MATREEIIANARGLESKGASSADIEEYVRRATSEMKAEAVSPANSNPPGIFRSAMRGVADAFPAIPQGLRWLLYPEEAKSFGKGVLGGAMMRPPEEDGVAPKSRKAGEFLGTVAPIMAAEATGGASLAAGAALRGSGIFGQAVARGAGTGILFEGMKGAVSGRDPIETVNKAAETGIEFAGFGAAGQLTGYLRNVFGGMSEDLMNHFLNVDRKIAMKLREQGRESIGKTVLGETEFTGFKNRDQIYDRAKQELGFTENRIQGRLEGAKGSISRDEIASSLDEVSSAYQTGTHPAQVKKVEFMRKGFLKSNPENMNLKEAMDLKRKLDDRVSKAYLAESGAKLPVEVEADEALANSLRAKIYEIDPMLGELAARESLMLKIRTSLSPKVAKSGDAHILSGFYRTLVNYLEGTPAANLVSKIGHSVFGKPSKVVAPVFRQGVRTAAVQEEK